MVLAFDVGNTNITCGIFEKEEWKATMFECECDILIPLPKSFDWLHKHHFDCRNLIPKGLAIDATGLNIY